MTDKVRLHIPRSKFFMEFVQNTDQNVAAQEVAALLSIHAQREPSSRFQNIIVQAPEDSKDVVAAAKRVLNQSDVNALGLRDQRDMTRLIAQSALQVISCVYTQKVSMCDYLTQRVYLPSIEETQKSPTGFLGIQDFLAS